MYSNKGQVRVLAQWPNRPALIPDFRRRERLDVFYSILNAMLVHQSYPPAFNSPVPRIHTPGW